MANELMVDKLTTKELECARNALEELWNSKEEYARAKRHLDELEIRMARLYDSVNYFLNHVKPVEAKEG